MSAQEGLPGEFRYSRRVQFAETDLAGIVHFSCYFRYMEEAEHALWRAAGLTIARAGETVGWPRISASFEFSRPLHFEDEIEVVVRIAAVNRRTIRYAVAVRHDEATVATGEMTIACVRKEAGTPMASMDVPSEVVEALRRVLGSEKVQKGFREGSEGVQSSQKIHDSE